MSRSVAPAIVGALLLAACGGGSSDSASTDRPVTDAEAARMAETLFNNHEVGNAAFVLNAALPGGATVRLDGVVDWSAGTGRAIVSASAGPEAQVTEVAWGPNQVLERIPAVQQMAAGTGRPAAPWVARPADPGLRQIDSLIGVVAGLATERPDNAVLIAQQPGTRWLRSDRRGNTGVDVLRYGERTVFWLIAGGVTLLRFEGNNADGTRPIVVDLSDHGAATVSLPPAGDVGDALLVSDLYEAIMGSAPGAR